MSELTTADIKTPKHGPCGAGEEIRPQSPGNIVADRLKDHWEHVATSYDDPNNPDKSEYHTICHGSTCEGSKDQYGLSKKDWEFLNSLPESAKYLVTVADVAFIGNGADEDSDEYVRAICLNMNDTFFYACGDGEAVKLEELDEVVRVYKQWGHIGLICWAAKKRGHDPAIEFTEDPVYQKTWTALYGDLKIAINPMLEKNPKYRWSDAKLNLKEWEPKS